jgi:hypothetical protein
MRSAILKLQPAMTNFCEYTPLLVNYRDSLCTNVSEPCLDLQISNFDHVVLITHKEVLARIPPTDIVSYIMLPEPLSVRNAMNTISEISYVNSSTYAYSFTFNLIGAYSMNKNFLVDHICITCDRIGDLKLAVFSHIHNVLTSFCYGTLDHVHNSMKLNSGLVAILQPTNEILSMLDCSNLARIESDFSHPLCLSQHMLHLDATYLYFTYICKPSCILYTLIYCHGHISICSTY